jgi:hypothetical protein
MDGEQGQAVDPDNIPSNNPDRSCETPVTAVAEDGRRLITTKSGSIWAPPPARQV